MQHSPNFAPRLGERKIFSSHHQRLAPDCLIMAFVPREYLRFPRLVPGRLGRYTQVCRLACWLKSVRRWPSKEEVTTERNQCLYRATGGFPQFQHQQRGNHLARSPPHKGSNTEFKKGSTIEVPWLEFRISRVISCASTVCITEGSRRTTRTGKVHRKKVPHQGTQAPLESRRKHH